MLDIDWADDSLVEMRARVVGKLGKGSSSITTMSMMGAAALAGAASAFALMPASIWASLDEAGEFEQLRIGGRSKMTLTLRNRGLLKPLRVISAESSCGCVRVESFPREVPTLRERPIVLTAHPGFSTAGAAASLLLSFSDGSRRLVSVQGSVLPPFDGWPHEARAAFMSDLIVLSFLPPYEAESFDARVFVGSSSRELAAEPIGAELFVHVPPEEAASDVFELVLVDREDPSLRWAGQLRDLSLIDGASIRKEGVP